MSISSTSFFPTIEVDSAVLLHMMQTDLVVWSQWDLPLPCDAAVMNVEVLKSQCQVPVVTKFHIVLPNMHGSSVYNLLCSPFWHLEF